MREQILYYAIRYEGDWGKIDKALRAQEPWEKIRYGEPYVTLGEKGYPKKLLKLQFPPWILFYEGDLSLLQRPGVAVIGSRDCSAQGIHNTHHVTSLLKERYVILSGLAKGIDAAAHDEALDHSTVGVIGCGLDIVYPLCNEKLYEVMRTRHLLISEYPRTTKPYAFHFPWRNRIIACLSEAVIVIEARKRSGSMLTVNEAINLDIPIYCLPAPYGILSREGCNLLIAQGANILVDDEDISLI